MRNRPLAVMACALAAALLTGPAQAAAKVCHLIVDRTDDDRYDIAAHDLVGGDIATGRSKLAAVIRVRSLADDPRATVYGATYRFTFTMGKSRYMYELRRALGSEDNARLFLGSEEIAKPEVRLDTKAHQITFLSPRSVFTPLRKNGVKIGDLNLDTGTGTVAVINTDNGIPVKAGTTYLDKTPSCVQVG